MNKAPHDPFLHPFSLKKTFRKRWKIKMEESWQHEKAENRIGYEGWYEQVPTACGGFIGLFQDKPTVILQFYTPKQRLTCRKLAEQFKDTPDVRLDDGFDGYESIFYFPVGLFESVAEAVRGRKRRQLSPEQKERLAEIGKTHRFKSSKHGVQESCTPQVERQATGE